MNEDIRNTVEGLMNEDIGSAGLMNENISSTVAGLMNEDMLLYCQCLHSLTMLLYC
jgi:hypothetical protein